jgi:hypothetical protein
VQNNCVSRRGNLGSTAAALNTLFENSIEERQASIPPYLLWKKTIKNLAKRQYTLVAQWGQQNKDVKHWYEFDLMML